MIKRTLNDIVDTERCPLSSQAYRDKCRERFEQSGALVLSCFLKSEAVEAIRCEGEASKHLAFYSPQNHNVYLMPPDSGYAKDHPRNREVMSSKGCITDDVVAPDSPLRLLYNAPEFRDFLCSVLGEEDLYCYADTLASINLHYANPGQELGWHFDNSEFAITLMIQTPERGGAFEYVPGVRVAESDDAGFESVARVLDGETDAKVLVMEPGTLTLFRGRDALHRVAPVEGSRTRMLAVLAYNTEPGIALSESARMTFFGRLG